MEPQATGIFIYVCRQCMAGKALMPHQWAHRGVHVQVKELPCSGKIDPEYMFAALEAGARGLLVMACPKGECRLAQGNYRAEIRVRTVQRLLSEIGIEPERVALAHCGPEDDVRAIADRAVEAFCALGESPIGARAAKTG